MNPSGGRGLPSPDTQHISRLHRLLLRWYANNARTLPWRSSDDAYAVLVSEFMLQQTQASRVIEHLPVWLRQFPDIRALAKAGRRSVLLAWSGMGYNRRAIALHETADMIMKSHGGRIPDDPAVLKSLPGIGPYTAHAVACFGYRKRTAMVDVNIRRIFSRLLVKQTDDTGMIRDAQAWDAAWTLLPQRSYYNWNQALMDLGALICTARRPDCADCPLNQLCLSSGHLKAAPQTVATVVRETPRRIYRGRVVELLRQAVGHELPASGLLTAVYGDDGASERERLADVLSTLRKDGLISVYPDDPGTAPEKLIVRLAE